MFSCRRAGSQEAPEPGRTFFWSCTRLPRPQAARGRPRDEGMSAVRSPDRHRRRLHEVSAGRTEGARNSISLVQPPHHAEPEMTTPPCAFAHRLFPDFLLRRPEARGWPAGPCSTTYLPAEDCVVLQTAGARPSPFGGEGRPRRKPQSPICLTASRDPQQAQARSDLHRVRFLRYAPADAATRDTRRTDCVHDADISSVPTPRTYEKPQDSNDPRWAHRRRAR